MQRAEAEGLAAGREEARASEARAGVESAQADAAAAARLERASSAATAAMVGLVANLGQELAEVLEGVEAANLRQQVERWDSAAVRDYRADGARPGLWNAEIVLPTLQTQLAADVHAMGLTMSAMLAQNDHVTGTPRVFFTVSTMAQATSGSSGGAATRHEAAGSVRINGPLQAAAEALGANPAAREELGRLGHLCSRRHRRTRASCPRCARRRPRR